MILDYLKSAFIVWLYGRLLLLPSIVPFLFSLLLQHALCRLFNSLSLFFLYHYYIFAASLNVIMAVPFSLSFLLSAVKKEGKRKSKTLFLKAVLFFFLLKARAGSMAVLQTLSLNYSEGPVLRMRAEGLVVSRCYWPSTSIWDNQWWRRMGAVVEQHLGHMFPTLGLEQ